MAICHASLFHRARSRLQELLAGLHHHFCDLVVHDLSPSNLSWTAGASSGLHHDFHDNLYILLRGRKRFRLYPPTDAPNMYTHGILKRIHSNGRIVYEGQVMMQPCRLHLYIRMLALLVKAR